MLRSTNNEVREPSSRTQRLNSFTSAVKDKNRVDTHQHVHHWVFAGFSTNNCEIDGHADVLVTALLYSALLHRVSSPDMLDAFHQLSGGPSEEHGLPT